jgi:uncharacterized protein YdhG (YjbR/CyaY superfamily)
MKAVRKSSKSTSSPDTGVFTEAAGLAEVEACLATIPEPARTTMLTVRERIRAAAPAGSTEEIGYGVPAFRAPESAGGALIAGYIARKNFCSYYPMSGRVIHDLAQDLAAYETTSGSIHFPLDKPLPLALIRKLVRQRLTDIQRRAAK